MTNPTRVVEDYIDGWNETDAERRRALIARTWTDSARYVDPLMRSEGHAGIDAMIQSVQARFPAFRFRRVGNVDAHNNCIRFSWELGPELGDAIVKGTDFATLGDEGRLQAVTGFIDQMPASG